MKKKYGIIIITILLIVIDQISKLLIINSLNLLESKIIIPNFLKFTYINNTGISFGLFGGKQIIIIIITLLIIAVMIYELIKNNNKLVIISSILILGGAFGNLIDRIFRGYVVDFVSFTLFNNEMAIFNLADTFITFGVIIYVISIILEGKNERNSSKWRK